MQRPELFFHLYLVCPHQLLLGSESQHTDDAHGLLHRLLNTARKGNVEYIDKLIKAGADVNKIGVGDRTSLICVASLGHHKCVDILIQAGADVNIQDKYGKTALISA